jgi:hypothetical protein
VEGVFSEVRILGILRSLAPTIGQWHYALSCVVG